MLEWHVITSATYHGADVSALNDEYLYFLSDTGEIYKGSTPFREAAEVVSSWPATPARRRIYFDATTMEGRVWDGTAWTTVVKPVKSAVTADDLNPVNSKAVIDYVTAEIAKVTGESDLIADVTYDASKIALNVKTAAGVNDELVLSGIGVQLAYDETTGALTLKDITGAVLGTAINLDLERFVKEASYDHESRTITLSFNDESTPLEIEIGDLVDVYTAKSGKGVQLTVTNNEFAAEAIISSAEGNIVELKDDGLYVAVTDLSNYQTLIAGATANNIVSVNAAGQVIDSGYAAGSAALGTGEKVLATEAAVQAAITSLKNTLDAEIAKKMNLVSGATQGNIATFGANGQVVDSTKNLGGATLAASPSANTLATEAAVKAADDAVAQKAAEDLATAKGELQKSIDDGLALKLDKTDVVALTSSATTGQAADAAATYQALTWKTTL